MRKLSFAMVVLCVSVQFLMAQTTDLFISEYVEGSSYNKAVELYNGTGFDVDLTDYTLESYSNGSDSVSYSIEFDSILQDGDVFVLAHSSSDSLIQLKADTVLGGVMRFNGDDAIVLRKNGVLIDIIGEIGVDPGSEWGDDLLSTADNTLRRKSTICSGNTVFQLESEWEGFEKDTFDGLGSHYADCGGVTVTPIFDIQYTEDPSGDSPYKDQIDITTEGIVTAIFQDGYFIQDQSGGAWSGLWVADDLNTPACGDRLRVTGTIAEINSMTALRDLSDYIVLSNDNSISALAILSGDVEQEQWEGVLVQVENAVVTDADLGDGYWAVDDGTGDAMVGAKGAYSYAPVLDDELDFVCGPVDGSNLTFAIQPRGDDDIQIKIDLSLVMNEIHADPDAQHGDANGDGVVDTADDEFVEIVNASDADVDISGWTLADATSIRHTFPPETILRQNGAVVVFGGGEPAGDFGDAQVFTASTGSLGLNNSGDTIILNDGATDQVVLSYEDAGDNQSITRAPDVTGETFVQHSEAQHSDSTLYSPGCYCGGFCFHATLIHDIQGTSATSPFDGAANVVVEGVVVGDFQASTELNGFFVQEEIPQVDAYESTSEGLFVHDDGFGVNVNVGDKVRITGTVREYYDRTELADVSDLNSLDVAPVPEATILTLPMSSPDDWEAFEGMLVRIDQELTVTGNSSLADYGEVELAVNGRLYTPTNCVAPGDDAVAQQSENDCCRIQLEDGNRVENPDPVPYLNGDRTLRLGSALSSLVGILDYSFESYEIHPIEDVQFSEVNARLETPTSVNAVVKAAAFNLNNFFNGDGQGGGFPTSRGATSHDEYVRQRDKLINAMIAMDADLLGLVELENDGFGEYSAIQDVVNGLNEAMAPDTYDFINAGLAQIGDDDVTCGIIYKPGLLTPLGDLAILDNSVDPTFDPTNRPSLAQTFQDTSGENFTFVINHFRSRSSACPADEDQGDGQGHCNQTRVNAATSLVNWLSTDPTASNDGDFIIMGDFNAYTHEDPITVIQDAGYVDLVEQNIGEHAYSYVYGAQSGTIDHAFVSTSLNSQITGLTQWHINADEPRALDYRSDNPPDLYGSGPFRSSDHDPVIVGLELEPIVVELSLFQAIFENSEVTISWKTESEIGIAGFHVLRGQKQDGAFAKINSDLIVSQGDSGRGAEYSYVDPDGSTQYFYKLESISLDGQSSLYGPIAVNFADDVFSKTLPKKFALHANYPNPFNPSTIIGYDVPHVEDVTIGIYDLQGRLVRMMVNKEQDAGFYELKWNGRNAFGELVAAGLYFCRMDAGDYWAVRKMMLVK